MTASVLRFPATQSRQATVIFLHGLGQTTEVWRATMHWFFRQFPNIEWILPQAFSKPVSYNQGQLRASWFDIGNLPPGYLEWDEAGISQAIGSIEGIIQAEVHRGVDSRKIVLMGFSQGAALSLMVGLTSLHELGGVASLSGWIPHRMREHIIQTDPSLPVFWGYGINDTDIPPYYSEEAMGFLRDVLRFPAHLLCFKGYQGLGHSVSTEEMNDLTNWLLRVSRLQPVVNGIRTV
ncbi:hypothetical protein EWM64_g1655 [Hericium alpestre]|uniref:Acyl-protein thioesterase 1 n=1 Tax=Hericium alpestre TaxID=135208 RepID=A0A4Z0A7V5_9AGAM|nr:hypothetical protein EWM64_g1655 [Hericium alpestre]